MAKRDRADGHGMDRRTFVKGGLAAGGLIAGAGAAIWAATGGGGKETPPPARPSPQGRRRVRKGAPNVLVIVVDQMRFPQWFGPAANRVGLPPNLALLRQDAVSFERHYTAANDCTPSRAALLTGLYTHQTGCMITGASTLYAGFPTWGTMLREHGYKTYWYGKWHLTRGDHHWSEARGRPLLESYGFSGGTYPSPDGAPGQGWRVDPRITDQFAAWYSDHADRQPWCTTVSLVNPHDIAWWYERTDRFRAEASARRVVSRLPPNFETPAQLIERGKPRLQLSLQETSARSFGAVPFTGPDVQAAWLPFLDLYMKLELAADRHIGRILHTLHSRPEVAANTVIVFTADHGEYGASHGLRGKGAGAYEEGIRVPLLVKDPRGRLTGAPQQPRTQLTSSVDVAPLLLTIATGSEDWRRERYYEHLAGRLELSALLADPDAPGRAHVLHTTDEIVTEYAIELYAADAPLHVVALRTPHAKYAVYADWTTDGIDLLPAGQESELYDYSTESGHLELHNSAGDNPLDRTMNAELLRALSDELRATLPQRLLAASEAGIDDYLFTAKAAAAAATARRRRRREAERGAAGRGIL